VQWLPLNAITESCTEFVVTPLCRQAMFRHYAKSWRTPDAIEHNPRDRLERNGLRPSGIDGKAYSLAEVRGSKGVVVVFL
jgi:hypothetical protein